MVWGLKHGPHLETYLQVKETTGHTPQALLDRPKLEPDQAYWLDSFYDLAGSRQQGEAPGPIPVSEYLAYFELMRIEEQEQREKHLRILRKLDSEYLKHAHEQIKQQSAGKRKS